LGVGNPLVFKKQGRRAVAWPKSRKRGGVRAVTRGKEAFFGENLANGEGGNIYTQVLRES